MRSPGLAPAALTVAAIFLTVVRVGRIERVPEPVQAHMFVSHVASDPLVGDDVYVATIVTPQLEPGAADMAIGGQFFFPRTVVKGIPYVAQTSIRATQALADGNRIQRTSTSEVCRDSEGRTRREQSLAGLAGLAPTLGELHLVIIDDPVAGVVLTLQVAAKTATRVAVPAPRSNLPYVIVPPAPAAGGHSRSESFGFREILGYQAQGVRTVVTLPADQVGSDRPIEIVAEQWYSHDLRVPLMTRYSDPRTGETIHEVTKIERVEPSPSLFAVPPGYRVTDR